MADKSVKDIATMVGRPVETLLEQLVSAGLPARKAEDTISSTEQALLVEFLKRAHGAESDNQITLQRKTQQTAQVASSNGRAKTINVEVRKKQTFAKPDLSVAKANAMAAAALEAAVKAEAELAKNAKVEVAPVAKSAEPVKTVSTASKLSEAAHTMANAKAAHAPKSAMHSTVNTTADTAKELAKKEAAKKELAKKEATKKRVQETPEQKTAREKEAARLKNAEETARKVAADLAQQRIAEQMKLMATKYADGADASRPVDDATPIADGLVGKAYEESFEKENRDIKRGAVPQNQAGARLGKGAGRNKRDGQQEERSFKQPIRGLKTSGGNKHGFAKPVEKQVYDVEIGSSIVVSDLAVKMAVKVREVIKTLMKMGEIATQNQSIEQDIASLVVEEMGHNPILISDNAAEDKLMEAATKDRGELITRAPVVTIMGHVDHGKTSLLDYIRKTKVASGEAGGITQHIGAYHVNTDRGMITFMDTPGHAAFSKMRERGAKATDIVIIIVAADDGVMPQTVEAIKHAQAANSPIIVAINKMDKEGSDIDKVLAELSQHGINTEAWGGDTPVAKISAKTGAGVDDLLDLISIQAEMMELKASDKGAAQGVVIESRVEKGRGAVVSLLVQKGMLNVGDLVLAGAFFGRVRAMVDDAGKPIKSAGPSMPVEILGIPDTPNAGDEMLVVSDEKKAREVASYRADKERADKLDRANGMRLENLMANMGKKDVPTVNIVLKTDVRGSLEALSSALYDLAVADVNVRIISSGVGAISESDVTTAEQAGAVLLGFNVRADTAARQKSDMDGIDIRYYSVLYELIDDVKAAMSGLLAPEHREKILGVAQVRQVFRSSKFGAAAGCMVMEGTLYRNKPIRVLRDGVVIFQGELESLRRHKDDVNEVRNGIECGLGVKGYNDIKELDHIENYEVQIIKRSL